jgi:hypothetical protein
MTLLQSDGYGRRFYADQKREYRIEPVHTSVPDGSGKPWAYITTLTGYRVVSDEWYRRGDEKDFDTVEHFRADTEAQCRAYMNRGAT